MNALPITSTLAIVVTLCTNAVADGLIFNLPPDGTRVSFEYSQRGRITHFSGVSDEDRDALIKMQKQEIETKGSITIASVGTVNHGGEPCRWIEIAWTMKQDVEKDYRKEISKFLIPVKYLTSGADPLSHVIKIYHFNVPGNPDVREIVDEDHRKIELDRFRQFFPKPVSKSNRVHKLFKNQEVETPIGKVSCSRHLFDSHFDTQLGGPTRMQWSGIHNIWRNDDVPFGVVALSLDSVSQEVAIPLKQLPSGNVVLRAISASSKQHLTLKTIEHNVKSRFPEHK